MKKKTEWIEKSMANIRDRFGDRLQGYEFDYLSEKLDQAWNRGNNEGHREAHELRMKAIQGEDETP